MTQKAWEKALLKQLKSLPKAERNVAIEYYREIYGDKLDAGYSEEEILEEFGSPEACATCILSEDTGEAAEVERIPTPSFRDNYSIAWIVGMFFFTILLILPLTFVALSLIIAFGITSLSGFIVVIAGIALTVGSPFFSLSGALFPSVVTGMGIGICGIGIGAVLFTAFFFATKYLTIWSYKALKFIYIRRTNE